MERIIAQSPAMRQILSDVAKIARSDASVFISGESGTGKEVIAKAIHAMSERKDKPFVKVNCAAIPETLIESEFFGHEKGSFTGALSRRLGRFELAHEGTLLLDEISEISQHVQAKLLRVVQEQIFERVGGVIPIEVNVRLIATSNRNMKETIEKKLFREDLYYRLNVIPIHLSPLRERKEDIIPLAHFFLENLCKGRSLSEEACQKLIDYPWPGNIRELANVMERTVVIASEERILAHHLNMDPYPSCKVERAFPVGTTLQELEKQMILETLLAHDNNRTKTAEILGISIRTLRNKLQGYMGSGPL